MFLKYVFQERQPMITITKEDWLFVFNEEDLEYDNKFYDLFRKYYANMLEKSLCANSAKTDCPFRISGTANPF